MITIDQRVNGKRRFIALGDSLMDVEHWLATSPKTWTANSSWRNNPSTTWDLNTSYEQAMKLARTGWSEGAKDLYGRIQASMPVRDSVAKWRYDVAGERPDVGRYLSGDPASMMRHGHPKGQKPVITLAVNIRLMCSVKAAAATNYGAAIVHMIDQLEHSGRRVEVIATFATTSGDGILSTGWIVKKAEDSVDLSALAFSLAHPAASRRIGFAMYEHSSFKTDMGYGGTTVLCTDDLYDPSPNTFCIGGLNAVTDRCHSMDDAIRFAADQINKAAGETLVEVEG